MQDSKWTGRIDGTAKNELRWHQIVTPFNKVENNLNNQWVIHGFCSDEGVRRNKGRVGAKDAPDALRSIMSNFATQDLTQIIDYGNVFCENQNLEEAQQNLANKVSTIISKKGKSLVLGGGHEVTFAHYQGIKQAHPNAKVGIINIDAHFDNRPIHPSIGASSGTGFYQIAEQDDIYSLTLGIYKHSNTKTLFDYANSKGMQYILADDFTPENKPALLQQIADFFNKVDVLYLTVCMDVFSASFAPGVSATAYNGIIPDTFFLSIFRNIIQNPKLIAFDVAEVNPKLDIDNRTVKLASSLIYEVMQ